MMGTLYSSSVKNCSGTYLDSKTLKCPSSEQLDNWAGYCYGVNYNFCGRITSHKLTEMKAHSSKIIFFDTANNNSDGLPNNRQYWRFLPTFKTLTDTGWGWPSSRHNSSCNTLHLDGHVQSFKIPNLSKIKVPCVSSKHHPPTLFTPRWALSTWPVPRPPTRLGSCIQV